MRAFRVSPDCPQAGRDGLSSQDRYRTSRHDRLPHRSPPLRDFVVRIPCARARIGSRKALGSPPFIPPWSVPLAPQLGSSIWCQGSMRVGLPRARGTAPLVSLCGGIGKEGGTGTRARNLRLRKCETVARWSPPSWSRRAGQWLPSTSNSEQMPPSRILRVN